MIKRRISFILLGNIGFILLLTLSVITGCIQPAVAAAPTAPPATTPAPHPQFNLDIYGSQFGMSGYVFGFALSDIINKYHSWLRATAHEAVQPGTMPVLLMKNPAMLKNTVHYMWPNDAIKYAKGDKPLSAPYTTWRWLALVETLANVWVTLDPNIKTPADFAGKRVSMMAVTSGTRFAIEDILKYGFDNLDKVKRQYLRPTDAANALGDGTIDVAFIPLASAGPAWAKSPALDQLMKEKKVYFVDLTEAAMKKVSQMSTWDQTYTLVPAGAYASYQGAFYTVTYANAWLGDAAMPDDVAYEFVKAIYDNVDKFASYTDLGKLMSKDKLGQVPMPEKYWHAGALKFYKEKGVKVGP